MVFSFLSFNRLLLCFSFRNMFQNTGFDVDLCTKHLKQIARTVQCSCSALYLNAYTCECGLSLCDSCWKAKKSCQTCSIKTKLQNRRQNEHLAKRSRHIKDLIDAFRIVAPTADNIIGDVCVELDDANEAVFEPVPKVNNFYINKRKNKHKVNLSDLVSASQNESNLVFPGEAIDISTDHQSRNNKPGLENVKNWLESTQNQFSERTDSQLENMNVVSNIPIRKIDSEPRGACKITVNQSDWDEIAVLESEPMIDSEKHNSDTFYNFVPADLVTNELRRSARNKVKDTEKVTTRKRSIKSTHKIVTDQITIENYIEPTTTKADVCNNSNANSSSEKKRTSKNEMWSSVKKMKQDFNKTNRRKVKKLNISIGSCKKSESVISKTSVPIVEEANMKLSPYIIEDSTPATPITISSYEKVIDKDRAACLQVLQKSELNHTNDSSKLEHPLLHFEVTDGALKQDKLKQILNKNDIDGNDEQQTAGIFQEKKQVISSEEGLHGKIDDSLIYTSVEININPKSVLSNSGANLDLPPVFLQEPNSVQEVKGRQKQSSQNNKWIPFIKKGKILGRCCYPNRKVPFYYKHQCRVPKKNVECGNIVITVEKSNMNTYINISNTDLTQRDNSKVSLRQSTEMRQAISKKQQSNVYSFANDKLESIPSKLTNDLAQAKINKVNDAVETYAIVDSLKANQPMQSSKKATESADTATVISTINAEKAGKDVEKDLDAIDDCDIFNSGSIAGESRNVMASGMAKQPSEIIPSTIQNKTQATEKDTRHIIDNKKRCRRSESQSPLRKKYKRGADQEEMENDDLSIVFHSEHALDKEKNVHEDSEHMNYDEIIGKVFANIDAEIEEKAKDKFTWREHVNEPLNKEKQGEDIPVDTSIDLSPHNEMEINNVNKIYSENLFSTIHEKVPGIKTLQQENECIIEEETAKQNPGVSSRNSTTELDVTNVSEHDLDEDHFVATPKNTKIVTGGDGSENCIVEDTPQKPKKSKLSISNAKSVSKDSHQNKDMSIDNRSVHSSLRLKQSTDKTKIAPMKKSSSISRDIQSLLNESVEGCDTQKQSVTELVDKISNEDLVVATPLNITKFTKDVKHNSTPMHPNARKLLDFNKKRMENEENSQSGKENMAAVNLSNVDVTLLTRKTSLEKDMTPNAFIAPSQPSVSAQRSGRAKFTLACSCLQPVQITNVKILALQKGWTYIDQYSSSLTHLIVGVDEGNISQRSVKYMRALAAGKWIVSYDWILQSLKEDKVINEAHYEVLDSTGAMGPKWSRTATKKLFTGITFFCMPPFTVLDENALSHMLEDAGGTVVKTIEEISLKTSKNVSLLLAEPESTQEDRFMYIAACNSVVPVNFEWALNSLGCYELISVRNLLLCPESLVCLDKLNWPKPLVDASSEELDTCE